MDHTAAAFAEEQLRRAIRACEDLQELRRFALRCLDLNTAQRQVFDSLIHWPEPYVPPAEDR